MGAPQRATIPAVLPDSETCTAEKEWELRFQEAGLPAKGLVAELQPTIRNESGRDNVTLSVALRNRGSAPLLIKRWKGCSDYEVFVRGPDGHLLKPRTATAAGEDGILDVKELEAGRSIEDVISIGGVFDFTNPGDYIVLVSVPVVGDVDAVLTAAPVKLHIAATK